jgi:hypothetical protein
MEAIKNNIAAWIDATEAAVLEGADQNGWSVSSRSRARKSPSRYLVLRRNGEAIEVRISDHKSVYRTENFSLSPDGFDHSLLEIIARLEAPQDES